MRNTILRLEFNNQIFEGKYLCRNKEYLKASKFIKTSKQIVSNLYCYSLALQIYIRGFLLTDSIAGDTHWLM